ncbi:Pat_PNPLA6_PNPLA7_NTE1_like domain containing protein [Flavobacteriaceae bacterium]
MKNISAFVFFILVFSQSSFSQEPIKPRQKVGLVLSGGGAKGFAHIGVLKVLEQAGVKIDYIGGTSIGGVVGGLYASGYNATQIDSIFKDTDFKNLITDFIPRSSKNFYEKRNDELYALTLPVNKFKVGIPVALSKGMYNFNLLSRLTNNVRHVRDFNKLPIPFLCIATDIETGEQVVLDKGSLPLALLASSAFPSLFSPVEIDGKLLVDGGVSNNYPIDEIRKLGADVIIGVDVQDDLKDRNSLNDATKILVQITNLQMIQKMRLNKATTDIYIKPEVNAFGIISFDDTQEIIKKGEEAAFSVFEKIKLLADSITTFKINNLKKESETLHINNININKLDNYTRSYVIGKLGFKARTKIDYNGLKIGIDNLSATQNFKKITYSFEKNGTEDDLNITLTENPQRTFLKFGFHYDGLFKSSVLVNLTQKKVLLKNDVALLDVGLGDNLRYNFEYYIDNGFHWSFGLKSKYNRFTKNVSTDFNNGLLLTQLGIKTLNIDYSDFTNQAYVQTVPFQKFLLGIGVEYKNLKISSETISNTTPILENSNYWSGFGSLKYDSFDNKYFPKRGWTFSTDFQTYLHSTDFTNQFHPFSIVKSDFGVVKTFYKKATIKFQSEAGVKIGKGSVPFLDFVLGGYGFNPTNNIKQFYGYDFISIAGNSFIKTSFTFDYEFYKKNHINFSGNYAQVNDELFENTEWISKPKFSGYAVGYGLETIVGPVEVKYTWSPELSKGYTLFTIGFWF